MAQKRIRNDSNSSSHMESGEARPGGNEPEMRHKQDMESLANG